MCVFAEARALAWCPATLPLPDPWLVHRPNPARMQASGDCNVDRKAALLQAEGVVFDVRTRRIVSDAALLPPGDFAPAVVARALVGTRHYSLPNILLGRRAFPELLQRDVTPDTMAAMILLVTSA